MRFSRFEVLEAQTALKNVQQQVTNVPGNCEDLLCNPK